jgi:O-antigen/teichoic acid export membrane protein
MSVKKNFGYNSILLLSQYVIPLIVFPYISRVLGVEKIGLVNYADSIVNYFILFSTMGLSLIGIRETAKKRENPFELNKVFSELLFLHIIVTFAMLCLYIGFIYFFDKFTEYKDLYLIGASKLIFNVFLIEWFFRGIENHKFITIRSVLIKVIYVLLVFLCVKNMKDYGVYFGLTCGVTVVNGMVNWWYSKRYVSIIYTNLNFKRHYKPFATIGFYMILTSMYTSFNVIYLGHVSTNISVGNYTTSLKLYTIILGLFSAMNTVLVPRLSSLIAKDDQINFDLVINKSVSFISMFSFPIIMCSIVLAPNIITVLAGSGYEGVVICFRIIMPLIFIVGIAQILSNQILMTLKKDKDLAIISFMGAIIGITLNIILVPLYNEVGSSLVVIISELTVTSILYYFCVKHTSVRLPFKDIFKHFTVSLPYLLICYFCAINVNNNILILIFSSFFSGLYFIGTQLWIVKNPLFLNEIEKFKR